MAKPKPKRPSEEQKKIEKTKVELKRRIPQEFQDFGESKISAKVLPVLTEIHILRGRPESMTQIVNPDLIFCKDKCEVQP